MCQALRAARVSSRSVAQQEHVRPNVPTRAARGLSIRQAEVDRYTVLATNRGGRESVEAFNLDARAATPSATWVGSASSCQIAWWETVSHPLTAEPS
jgi:hypothetical protein